MEKKTLLKQAEESLMYITNRPDLVFERGEGNYLFDTEGRKYLDFIAGWAVCSLGHSPGVITDVLVEQGRTLLTPSPAFYNKPMIELSAYLTRISCMDKVFFTNCGAEANEGAVKLARKYGRLHKDGANEIISTLHSFHGRTLAMMAATGKEHWVGLFGPRPGGFIHVPFNDLQALKSAITPRTIAIMLEPVQGEGGVNPVDREYLAAVRTLCDEKKILLVFDEVQTGIGRLGTMFGYEYYGIEPDVMTLAKGLGGGFPLGALLAKDKFCCFEAGDQGGTYCGAPLGTAVGLAVVKTIMETGILEGVRQNSAYMRGELEKIAGEFSFITGVRGAGLLLALGLNKELGAEIVGACMEEGLILNSPNKLTIRLMPALTVGKMEIDEMVSLLRKVLQRYADK